MSIDALAGDGADFCAAGGITWPGNVRELENTIERAVVLTTESTIRRAAITMEPAMRASSSGVTSLKLRQNIEWMECDTIRRALEMSPGKRQAARLMGISPRALSYYLAKYPNISQFFFFFFFF